MLNFSMKKCCRERFCQIATSLSLLATGCFVFAVVMTAMLRDAEYLNPRLNAATCVTTSHEITQRTCSSDDRGKRTLGEKLRIDRLKRGSYPCYDGSIVVTANFSSVFILSFQIRIYSGSKDSVALSAFPLQHAFSCFASNNPIKVVLQRPDESGFKIATIVLWCLFGLFAVAVILVTVFLFGKPCNK